VDAFPDEIVLERSKVKRGGVEVKERELLIYLHTIPGVGWKTIDQVRKTMDHLEQILTCQPLELSMKTGINYPTAEKITAAFAEDQIRSFFQKMEEWQDQHIQVITYDDQEYPDFLKEIAQPPWVLFALGDVKLMQKPALAVVGTRNATPYGKLVAEQLSSQITDYGFVVVSGLARGIDRFAHEGALQNQGKTIAVLGSGVNVIYPKENGRLYQTMKDQGLILAEYPPDTQPHPGFFPQRNRIISGLSYGTIVVEASLKSGSLITAQFALDQSREVFAVPGLITSKQSIGTNALIKQGAKLVQKIEDILEEFPYLMMKKIKEKEPRDLTEAEQKVFAVIQHDPIHINDIYHQMDLDMNQLYQTLLSLQLKGEVTQLPGGLYLRKSIE